MKILIDAHIFDGKYQGTRTYIKGLYSELIKRNPTWDFFFVANDIPNLASEFPNLENVHFIKFKFKNQYIRLIFELPYIIIKRKIDYSHFQYISPIIKVGKYIVTNHDILFREKRFKAYFPLLFKLVKSPLFYWSSVNADVLLTVSKYSQESISTHYNIPISRIGITPNSVNASLKGLNEGKRNKNILYVSRIEPRKNHVSVLKAFVNLKLNEKGYKLIFIGKYDLRYSEYDEFVRENASALKDSLITVSGLTENELVKQYNKAALVVFPSLAEGFGIPPLEAAVMNVKVICSNATAMKEFDFFKYHYDPDNQLEFEELILKAISDDIYPFDKIRNEILSAYNWEYAAKEYEKRLEGQKE